MGCHVVSFSGGKDSTALLLMMLEKGMAVDRIVSVDTTKEFPEMYRHIDRVKGYVKATYNKDIEVVGMNWDYWFSDHVRDGSSKYAHIQGFGWPDMRSRWCTSLKIEGFRDIVYGGHFAKDYKYNDVIEYHGIAFDEKHRVHKDTKTRKYTTVRHPLVDWGITEKQALQYCYSKGFDWEGLYTDFKRVSCFCCPLSSLKDLKVLYFKYPEVWQRIKDMDKLSQGRRFRNDYTLSQLELKFCKEASGD